MLGIGNPAERDWGGRPGRHGRGGFARKGCDTSQIWLPGNRLFTPARPALLHPAVQQRNSASQ